MKIEGKVVLITGASEGIGAACVDAFRAAGALVCLTARSEERMRTHAGPADLVIPGDLLQPEAPAAIINAVVERHGRIDVLVNNAGAGLYTPAHSGLPEPAEQLFRLNLFAPLALIRHAVPHMKRRGSGTLVNVSSIAGMVALPWFTMYSASKAALLAMSDGLRMELRGAGIHVMSVCPGYVRTRFQDNLMGGHVPPALGPLKQRWAISPEECARAIVSGTARGARNVVTPRSGWGLIAAARLFPRLIDRHLESIWLQQSGQAEADVT